MLLEFFPHGTSYNADSDSEVDNGVGNTAGGEDVEKINYQSSSRSGRNTANRYALQFYKESDQQLKQMKEDALKPLEFVDKINLEIGTNDFAGYNFPKRPEWTYAMSKEQLDRNENLSFTVSLAYIFCPMYFIKIQAAFRNILVALKSGTETKIRS